MEKSFDQDFLWGAATSAYQIEGAYNEDGRGESIWDRFVRTPGKVVGGQTGDMACDHYHRYEEDVAIMKSLGIDSYRFSLAWPRVFPTGKGNPNYQGLDFYKRLLDELEVSGIAPMLTLYHWELPQALQDAAGWVNRDTAKYFADYAAFIFEELADRIPLWITHNEPWCAAYLGYGNGHHAPGLADFAQSLQAAHHLLYSHGLAVERFLSLGLTGKIGIALNLHPIYPATDNPLDIAAADKVDGFTNRWYLDPVLKGEYPKDLLAWYEQLGWAPSIETGDLEVISSPINFLGINYYTRQVVSHDPKAHFGIKQHEPKGFLTEMGWEVFPAGLNELLVRLYQDYPKIDLYVTENGAAFADLLEERQIHDTTRQQYLANHIDQVLQAIQIGVPLKGYFVWSLLDNFEWAFGYSKRFGLVYVDYETQERVIKDSGNWYRDFIAANK